MMDVTSDSPAVDDGVVDGSSVRAGELDAVDEQLIARLAGRAREGGLALAGEDGGCWPSSPSGWSSPRSRGRSPTTSSTTATTRSAATAATPATVTAPRPC